MNEMKFIKYQSIENSYNEAYLEKMLSINPELNNEAFAIYEKIHGANFSMWLYPDGTVKYAKRTSFLKEDEKFFNYQKVVELLDLEKNIKIENFSLKKNRILVLVGELFGKGIQKGVNYHIENEIEKDIKFFDIQILHPDNCFYYLTPDEVLVLTNLLNIDKYFLCPLYHVSGLDNALNFDIEFNSTLNTIEDNVCEGIIIKPFSKNYFLRDKMGRFVLKKKNPEFMEKTCYQKKIRKQHDPAIFKWKAIFKKYLTENRLDNIWSKFGPLTDKKDIGKYVKELMNDAKDDFLKDHQKELEKENINIDECCRMGKYVGTMVISKYEKELTDKQKRV